MDRKACTVCATILVALLLVAGLTAACQEQIVYREALPVYMPELGQTTPVSPTEAVADMLPQINPAPVPGTVSVSVTEAVTGMLGQVNRDRAFSDLQKLAGEEPVCVDSQCYTITNRLTGSEGLRWAMDYIARELASLDYAVETQNWSREGYTDRNLMARKSGIYSPTEEVYFVAHVDGARKGLGERFPAADDNASGAVDNLELARILSGQTFSRTVILLFSTGEEQGSLGVKSYLAQRSAQELSAIKYVVDLDMIGYDANQDRVMELWHGDHAPSLALARAISETIGAYQLALAPRFLAGCG